MKREKASRVITVKPSVGTGPAPHRGILSAKVSLGLLYADGKGVSQDYVEAATWYRQVSEQDLGPETFFNFGDRTTQAIAQVLLGFVYAAGKGVPQDDAEAAKWLRKAAEQDNRTAQSTLGAYYEHGLGVVQDYSEALKWYRKAADQGDAASLFGVGLLYREGHGVPRNYVEAHKWLNIAAARAKADAQAQYADARDQLAKKMTPSEISEAQKRARVWMEAFDKCEREPSTSNCAQFWGR